MFPPNAADYPVDNRWLEPSVIVSPATTERPNMLIKLPNDDRIQVEHVERVTAPRRSIGDRFTFEVHMASGNSFNVDGKQDTVEEAHRKLIGAMSERA